MTDPTPVVHMRCVRCGDAHQREVGDPYLPLLCGPCCDRGIELLFHDNPDVFSRWCVRWQRDLERHPSFRTYTAAEEAWLESLRHGEVAL